MDKQSFYSNLSSITGRLNNLAWPLAAKELENVLVLPEKYLSLTRQIDVLKQVQTGIIKVTQSQFPLTMHRNNAGILQNPASTPSWGWSASVGPPTPYHAMAVTLSQCGLEIGVDEPIGSSLYKVATIQQKIGDARLVMDQKLSTDVVQPLNVNLNTNIKFIEKARQKVEQLLAQLNSARARHAASGSDPGAELEFELTTAQSSYDQALEHTIQLMLNVLEAPHTIQTLTELIQIQLAYHQEAFQLLSDIYPQVQDIAAAQEALRSLPPEPSLKNSEHTTSLSPTLNQQVTTFTSPLATPPLSPSLAPTDEISTVTASTPPHELS